MTESPLLRRTRERLAKQRELERQRYEVRPGALMKSMLGWMLRILGFLVLLGLIYLRMSGKSVLSL
jgi:hypothetical protein